MSKNTTSNIVNSDITVPLSDQNSIMPHSAHNCFIETLQTAAIYASLAYVKSRLNPFKIDNFSNETTHKLYQQYQDDFIDIYDAPSEKGVVGAIIHIQTHQTTIAFHGINFESQQDHITNFDSILVKSKYAPGKYHRGFLRLTTKIAPNIIAVLRQKLGVFWNQHPIKIYGHSMGGAVAQLFTQYLQHRYEKLNLETIVFGSPRTMCPKAAHAYNQKNNGRTFRVENSADLAIYMPTRILGYGLVNHAITLSKLQQSFARNHEIEGYLEMLNNAKRSMLMSGVSHITPDHYLQTLPNNSFPYYWPFSTSSGDIQTPFQEFMGSLGHSISHGIQAIIRKLPF